MKLRSVLYVGSVLLLVTVLSSTLLTEDQAEGQLTQNAGLMDHPGYPDPSRNDPSRLGRFMEMVSSIKQQQVRFLFENPGSVYSGINFHFVNTSQGNLTFRLRDLVLDGQIPIVLSRVYDSAGGQDNCTLGKGWRLSYDEYLEESPDGLILHLASGNRLVFPQDGSAFLRDHREPNNYRVPVTLSTDSVMIETKDGWQKVFQKINDHFRLVLITDPYGHELHLTYEKGRLVKLENDSGNWAKCTYDKLGMLREIRDSIGRQVHYAYDLHGNLESVVDRGGYVWTYQYAAGGLLTDIITPEQRMILNVDYDRFDKVQKLIDEDGCSFTYLYKEFQTVVTDALMEQTTFFHDDEGRVIKVRNAAGIETSVELNDQDQVTAYHMGDEEIARLSFDEQNHLLSAEVNGRGQYTYQYDEKGNLVYNQWPTGEFYQIERDELGRPLAIMTEKGPRCEFEYDANGQIIQYSFGQNMAWHLAYDERGNISYLSEGEKVGMEFLYDKRGALNSVILPDGAVITLAANELGRIVALDDGAGAALHNETNREGAITRSRIFTKDNVLEIATLREGNRWWLEVNGDHRLELRYDRGGNVTSVEQDGRQIQVNYGPNHQLISLVLDELAERIEDPSAKADPTSSGGSSKSSLWRDRIGAEEICSRPWEIAAEPSSNPLYSGIFFDPELAMFLLDWPVIEENRWMDHILDTRYIQLMKVLPELHEKSEKTMTTLGMVFNPRPGEYRSVDAPLTLFNKDDVCYCYFTLWGQFIECDEAYCEVFFVDFSIYPMDPPEPPAVECQATIFPPFEHYIKKGQTIVFNGFLWTYPPNSWLPDWNVYWKGSIRYGWLYNSTTFPQIFHDTGMYVVVAGKTNTNCMAFHVWVNVVDLDLKVKESLDGELNSTQEDNPGAYMHFNVDCDSGQDGATWPKEDHEVNNSVNGIPNENDLYKIELEMSHIPNDGSVVFHRSNDKIQVWKSRIKPSGSKIIFDSSNNKTWDLSTQRSDFESTISGLFIEGSGVSSGTLTLTYKSPTNESIVSDSVKCNFIAATCGWHPLPSERVGLKSKYPQLVDCEYSISKTYYEYNVTYNCLALAVGDREHYIWSGWGQGISEFDQYYGGYLQHIIDIDYLPGANANGVADLDDFVNFLNIKGYVFGNANNAEIILYELNGQIKHAVRLKNCSCGSPEWRMFEGKMGFNFEMEHRQGQLDNGDMGSQCYYFVKSK